MPDPGLATAADYSEALLTARRAKSTISLLLALMLVGQLAIFLLIRYDIVKLPASENPLAHVVDHALTTQPAVTSQRMIDLLHYASGVFVLAGLALTIILAATLCLIGHVMLVGRLIGVGKVTSALIWTIVLLVFLFPWQFFMSDLTVTDFRIPGALWTWGEMAARVHFDSNMADGHWADVVLSWFRFVGAPVIALILVLLIQMRSTRGLRMALGEDELLNEMMRQQ